MMRQVILFTSNLIVINVVKALLVSEQSIPTGNLSHYKGGNCCYFTTG